MDQRQLAKLKAIRLYVNSYFTDIRYILADYLFYVNKNPNTCINKVDTNTYIDLMWSNDKSNHLIVLEILYNHYKSI